MILPKTCTLTYSWTSSIQMLLRLPTFLAILLQKSLEYCYMWYRNYFAMNSVVLVVVSLLVDGKEGLGRQTRRPRCTN